MGCDSHGHSRSRKTRARQINQGTSHSSHYFKKSGRKSRSRGRHRSRFDTSEDSRSSDDRESSTTYDSRASGSESSENSRSSELDSSSVDEGRKAQKASHSRCRLRKNSACSGMDILGCHKQSVKDHGGKAHTRYKGLGRHCRQSGNLGNSRRRRGSRPRLRERGSTMGPNMRIFKYRDGRWFSAVNKDTIGLCRLWR